MIQASRLLVLWGLGACLGAGCGGTTPPGDDDDADGPGDDDDDAPHCSDQDGDGYGVGDDCLGDDCDDSNEDVQSCDCGAAGDAVATGCPCDALQPVVCYEGTDGTAGHGDCTTGLRHCRDHTWSICEGQVRDLAEVCDGNDNDCDDERDEGVLGPCGDCNPACESLEYGPSEGATGFEPDESNASGIVGTPEGYLTLSQQAVSTHVIWIANSLDGTISKFDTRTRDEVARYRTGPLGTSSGLWGGAGDNPSRTSVNYFGDAYVANRAFSGVASVTKILNDGCPDNGDGSVDTSTGGDDVLPWTGDGPEDDCIAWNTALGMNAGLGRSVTAQVRAELDGTPHEYAWLGIYSEQRYYEIDGDTGEPTGVEVDLAGCTPYGAAIDASGNLWSASLGSTLGRFDTYDPADKEVIQLPAGQSSYGLTVDALGHVWNSSYGISRYRPEDGEWDVVATNTFTAGIAIDAQGIVWANGDSGTLVRIDSNDPALPFTTMATGRGGRGVGVDFDGYVWFINWSRAGSDGDVTLIDPAEPDNFETLCCDSINNSYTYSDMTGFQLRNATAPRGTYELIVEGCEPPELTQWAGIMFDGDFPESTALRIDVRTAESLVALSAATWIVVGTHPPEASPFDVRAALEEAGVEPAQYLGVRITLESFDRDALPVVRGLGIQRSCSNPFG